MPGLIGRRSTGTRSGDQRWIGSRHALDSAKTATLDLDAFTKATHYPNGYLPSGLPVNAADPANVVPYTGTGVLRFLKDNHQVVVDDLGTVPSELQVALLWHGLVYTDVLPVAFTAPTGDAGGFTFEELNV
jgi:hypothetical protein